MNCVLDTCFDMTHETGIRTDWKIFDCSCVDWKTLLNILIDWKMLNIPRPEDSEYPQSGRF